MLRQFILRLRPHASLKHRELGDQLRDKKLFSEAADSYQKYLHDHPDDFAIWVQAGNCFKDAKSFEKAQTSYATAMRLDPKNSDLQLQIGHLAKMMGDKNMAAESYRRALELDGSNIAAALELDEIDILTTEALSEKNCRIAPAAMPQLKLNVSNRYSSPAANISQQIEEIKKSLIAR